MFEITKCAHRLLELYRATSLLKANESHLVNQLLGFGRRKKNRYAADS